MVNIGKIMKVGVCAGLVAGMTIMSGCENSELNDYKAQAEKLIIEKDNTIADKESSISELNTQVNDLETDIEEVNEVVTKAALEKLEADAKVLADAEEIAKLNGEIEGLTAEIVVVTETTEAEETEEVTVASGESIDISFNSSLPLNKQILDDNEIEGLIDSKITFDGEDYDVKETIEFTDDFKLQTSIEGDEEFADAPYLVTTARGAIKYIYNFEDTINSTEISEDEPLNIRFLGKETEIVAVDKDDKTITIREGTTTLLEEGEEKTVVLKDGTEVIIKNTYIGTNGAKFEIGGQATSSLSKGESDEAGGQEVSVIEILENEAGEVAGGDKVEIKIGTDIYKTIDNGEEYVEDDETFIYDFVFTGDELESIGVSYDLKTDELADEEDGQAPKTVGEAIEFPEGYIKVKLSELSTEDYAKYTISFDEYGDDNVQVMEIQAQEDETIVIDNDEVEKVYLNETHAIYKKDGDYLVVELEPTVFNLEFDETSLAISYDVGGYVLIGDLNITTDFTKLGATEEKSEATEIVYGGKSIGTSDYDVLTTDGIIITVKEDRDEFDLSIPSEEVLGTITVSQ